MTQRQITTVLLLFLSGIAHAVLPPSPAAYGVRMQNSWIPMHDGVRLSVTLYMPDGAKLAEKFPAILEYHPYRKDDSMAAEDYEMYSYFARRGFVGARVDIRGFGNSEGKPTDREYSEQEQQDGLQIIHWLATQPWSNGNVGMMGISWSGFNSLQMAMRNPPELKAILAADATAELFHDDIHYIDGMMHIDEFELNMDMVPGMTGAPDFTLDEGVLGPRFDAAPWSLLYIKHQHDGQFWRSPVRPYSDIKVPCFLIAGMQDGYRDSVPDMLMRTKAPIRAIVGPWNHTYPHNADFGPFIEWREQAVRWWDYWLKGRDTGVVNDPRLTVYIQHWHPPDVHLKAIPGEWRAENTWPPPDAKPQTLFLRSDHSLGETASVAGTHQLKYVPSVGVEGGFWWGELMADVRPMDAYSLVYDSVPLQEDTAILGRPRVLLQASADATQADWITRLSDVAPDGTVTQITGAGINGAHRDSMTDPKELEPGKVYPLNIEMHLTSWVFPKGHRIRLAVSNALWPMVMPTPYSMTTSLELGGEQGSRIVLPIVPGRSDSVPTFALPGLSDERKDITSAGEMIPGEWTVTHNLQTHDATANWHGQTQENYPWAKETDYESLTYKTNDEHPEQSSALGEAKTVVELKDRVLTWQGHLSLTTDQKNFYYKYTRELFKDGKIVKQKTWEATIPRDHQ